MDAADIAWKLSLVMRGAAKPALLDSYWMQVVTGVVIYSIMTLGLGLLIGRVGLVSLCQFVLAAVGAWVALRLSYATDLPFPILILIAGVVTGVVGTLIGLPALRLSGLHLALITLMAAGAITVLLRIAQFPNGGGGFFGNTAARPARISSGAQPCRWKLTMSDCMNTAQP